MWIINNKARTMQFSCYNLLNSAKNESVDD